MSYDLADTLRRAQARLITQTPEPWPSPVHDAMHLAFFISRLVAQVHELNKDVAHPQDLCPICAGTTWGRPGRTTPSADGDTRDYTRRVCSECGHTRPEPEKNEL